MTRLLIVAALLVLGGCAAKPTVSENQCRAGDWQTIGYRDGASGFASTRLLSHQEACGEFAIVPERTAYLTGWQEGLSSFCTADNGFNLGNRGASFNTVCARDMAEPFATAYQDGRQLYLARAEVNRLNRLINSKEARLDQLKQEIVGATTAQLVPDLTPEERIGLVAKLEDLISEREEIQNELPELERDLAAAEYELDRLNQTLASVSYS